MTGGMSDEALARHESSLAGIAPSTPERRTIGWVLLVAAALLIAPPPFWAWLDVAWLNQSSRAFLGLQAIVAWSQLRYGRPGTDAVVHLVAAATIVGLALLAIRPSWHYWPTLTAQAVLIVAIHIRARKAV